MVLNAIAYHSLHTLQIMVAMSEKKNKPTDEQQKIIESESDFLKVNAFAGTGKTSTLVEYAEHRNRERILYICFNKSIKLEAERKFGRNVFPKTSHGLAFRDFGVNFLEAKKLVDKIRVNEAVAALGLDEYPEDFRLYVADTTLKCIDRFVNSADTKILEAHCSSFITPDTGIDAGDITELAETLWAKMVNLKDSSIGIVPDIYLKLYQLSSPDLSFYDRILFDEAQDANAVTASIFEMQKAAKVVVGDTHQQLYSFRGAMNAMRKFNSDTTLYLSQSFRFGQGIADVANALLSTYKGETRSLKGTDAVTYLGDIPSSTRTAFIARSNGSIMEEAARCLAMNKKISFVGGAENYRLSSALDVHNLRMGERSRIFNPFIKAFKSFEVLEDYARAVDDRELKSLINVSKKHNHKLPSLISSIRAHSGETNEADVILTTAHKSKGLEFDHVRLANDFTDLFDEKTGQPKHMTYSEQEEINIAYVAATRAQKSLQMFPDLSNLMRVQRAKVTQSKMADWARPVEIKPIKAIGAKI